MTGFSTLHRIIASKHFSIDEFVKSSSWKSSSVPIDHGREGWRANRALRFFRGLARRRAFEKPLGKQKTEEGITTSRTLVMQVLDPFALH